MNEKVIAAIKIEADNLHLLEDVNRLQETHQHNESARRLVHSLVSSKGGRPIGTIQGAEIVELPLESIEVLREINKRLQAELQLEASIGVGEDSREALAALKHIDSKDPGSIKVYEPEIETPAAPSHEKSVAVDQTDQIQKSEQKPEISHEQKLQIAQLFDDLKNNRESIESLRQQAPQVYDGIVSMVQSLHMMVLSDKQDQEQQIAKMIEKINQHLDKHHNKQIDKQGKEIQKEVNRAVKILSQIESKKRKSFMDISHQNNKKRRKDALEYGKSVGHNNPIFFHHLINEFRKK